MDNEVKNILYITTRLPWPLIGGDRLHIYHYLKELKQKGHKITLISLVSDNDDLDGALKHNEFYTKLIPIKFNKKLAYLNAVKAVFNDKPFIVEYFYNKKMQKIINEEIKIGTYDIAIGYIIRSYPYLKKHKNIKKIIHLCDAISMMYERRIQEKRNLFDKLKIWIEYLKVKNYEKKSCKYSDKQVLISDTDKIYLSRFADIRNCEIIGLATDTEYYKPISANKKNNICFVGSMQYIPNSEAAIYFATKVFSLIKKEIPDAKFKIIGANPRKDLFEAVKGIDGVEVTGKVEDVRECMKDCKVSVCPVKIAGGIQNKTLFLLSEPDFTGKFPLLHLTDCRKKGGELKSVFRAVFKNAGRSVHGQTYSAFIRRLSEPDIRKQTEKLQIAEETPQFCRIAIRDFQRQPRGMQNQTLHQRNIISFQQFLREGFPDPFKRFLFGEIGIDPVPERRGISGILIAEVPEDAFPHVFRMRRQTAFPEHGCAFQKKSSAQIRKFGTAAGGGEFSPVGKGFQNASCQFQILLAEKKAGCEFVESPACGSRAVFVELQKRRGKMQQTGIRRIDERGFQIVAVLFETEKFGTEHGSCAPDWSGGGVPVGPVPAAAVADAHFGSPLADQFIETGLLPFFCPENASETLDMLPDARTPGNHDPDIRLRHIHSLVQHFAGHQHGIVSVPEGFEEILSFRGPGLVGEDRQAELFADGVRRVVVRSEDQNPGIGIVPDDVPEDFDFRMAAAGNGALAEIGVQDIASFAPSCAEGQEAAPGAGFGKADAVGMEEAGVLFPGFAVLESLLLRGLFPTERGFF